MIVVQGATWGPLDGLENIPAWAYPIGDEIKLTSPARSVQFILVELGDRVLTVEDGRITENDGSVPTQFRVYPTPTSGLFKIELQRGKFNKVDIVDLMGRIVYSKAISLSETVLHLQPDLASGSYFVRLHNQKEVKVTRLIMSK